MKFYILLIAVCLFSCNDSNNSLTTEYKQLKQEHDSITHVAAINDSNSKALADTGQYAPPPSERAGVHPITLQWISWDKMGEVAVKPANDGWYTITGSQSNAEKDYLKIDGKIKRVSDKELEFEGTIEIKVSHNNGGEPCIKKGTQQFFAKGNRKYFRMQDMTNCEGGSLVDYVDIYPGTSSL